MTDRSYLIREGQVFAYGTPGEILLNPDVRRYYLGDRFDAGHLLEEIHRRSLLHGEPGTDSPDVVIDPIDYDPPTAPGGGLPTGPRVPPK